VDLTAEGRRMERILLAEVLLLAVFALVAIA
jgi:hypothetical protein